jgi:hypothetical protein
MTLLLESKQTKSLFVRPFVDEVLGLKLAYAFERHLGRLLYLGA